MPASPDQPYSTILLSSSSQDLLVSLTGANSISLVVDLQLATARCFEVAHSDSYYVMTLILVVMHNMIMLILL
jgi:hypothetical protein